MNKLNQTVHSTNRTTNQSQKTPQKKDNLKITNIKKKTFLIAFSYLLHINQRKKRERLLSR